MGSLVKAVLLSVLLDPAFLLTQQDEASHSAEPTPSLHVRFDRSTMSLIWDCQENATAIRWEMIRKDNASVNMKGGWLKEKDGHCTFQNSCLHEGLPFIITVHVSQGQITGKVFFTNPGAAGTAAQNFSCLIYEADFMNCTWAKGPSAPDDVQYFLYLKESKKNPNERECPRYTEDAGTHVGCHFQNLSQLPFNTYFLVNGTSQQTAIQFFDTVLSIHKIERYSPPHNITVHCNKSRCLIQWEKPRTRRRVSALDFQFQLDIRMQDSTQPGGNQRVEVSGATENKYSFLNPPPKARHTVRIRAADARLLQWSAWSQPVAFGSEEQEASPIPVYMLVVLGTLVGSLVLGFVLKRILQRYCVCTPVPGIKDTLNENHQTDNQIVWEAMAIDAGKSNDEEILTVQEVTEHTATP